MSALADTLRQRLRSGRLELPLPGGGDTPARHRALFEIGREDLSLARLVEAHTDAVAILREAGSAPALGALYGVWASETPKHRLEVSADGRSLSGSKRFCSGASLVDRALVTAHGPDGVLLFDVPIRGCGAVTVTDVDWQTPAFAETRTGTIEVQGLGLEADARVGGPGWYLERPGFWLGALGPACCWAGGAAGLVDRAERSRRSGPHVQAQRGALDAARWMLEQILEAAGREADASPRDAKAAQVRALRVRHLVERTAIDVLDRFGRACGPGPLAFDAAAARRHAELTLYIRQCHAEADLEALAGLRLEPTSR